MRPQPPVRRGADGRNGAKSVTTARTSKGGAVATAAMAGTLTLPWRRETASTRALLQSAPTAAAFSPAAPHSLSTPHGLFSARTARRLRPTAAVPGNGGVGASDISANRGGVAGPLRVPPATNAASSFDLSSPSSSPRSSTAVAAVAAAPSSSSSPKSLSALPTSSGSSSATTATSSPSDSLAPPSLPSSPPSPSSPPDTLSTLNTASSAVILAPVAADMEQMNANLRGIVGDRHPMLQAAAEQIFGAGGKRLRPAIVFLVARATAELMGLSDLTLKHRRLAEITEMIHTASLVHDDVLDDCSTRRGAATVNSTYGARLAVLVGDFLFAQSSWALANLDNMEVIKLISQVIADFANGEISQASALFDTSLTLQAYLDKSFYKTATLIAASARSAAVFSGCDEGVKAAMFEYGRRLGLAFQVVDDVLDFTQDEALLGKPRGQDLASGNLTAPVVFALRHPEHGEELRELIEGEFPDGEGDLDRAMSLVREAGGLDAARALARSEADAARKALEPLPEGSEARASLELMVEYVLDRLY